MDRRKIVIFGAGIRGKRYLQSLLDAGIDVDYICDNNEELWGKQIGNCKIISPEELERHREEVSVLIANKFHSEEIEKQLQKMRVAYTDDPAEMIFHTIRMKTSERRFANQKSISLQLTVVIYGDLEDSSEYEATYQSIYSQNTNVAFNIKKWNKNIIDDVEDQVLLIKSGTIMLDNCINELWMMKERAAIVGSKTITKEGIIEQAGYFFKKNGMISALGKGEKAAEPEYEYVRECDMVSMNGILLQKKDFAKLIDQYAKYNNEEAYIYFALQMRKQEKKMVMTPFSLIVTSQKNCSEIFKVELTEEQREINKTEQLNMLLADTTIAQYDTNAGNRSTDCYIQIFLELGLQISYLIDDFYYEYKYVTYYQRKGIFVIYGERWKKDTEKLLKNILSNIKYVFLNRPEIAAKYLPIIRKYSQALVVHYGHDLHYLRLQREYAIEKEADILSEANRMKKLEYTLVDQVDITGYPSMEEVKILKKEFPTAEIEYFPLYFFPTMNRKVKKEQRQGIMFVGGFVHAPNRDAAIWLVKDILPMLRERGIKDKVYLVGSNPTEEILTLQNEDVIVTGYVTDEELQAYYEKCFVDILPLRYGAGMKGKVLEAMYNGIPTVTTTIGAEGLYGVENILYLGDTVDTIVDKTCFLYQNKGKMKNIISLEQKYIQKYFGKEAMEKLIVNQLQRIKK